jgi:PAS domain S-box-containing protein
LKPEQVLREAHERLKAEAAELARANDALRRELAEQKFSLSMLRSNALRSLAEISGDWYWEQDAAYRFVEFVVDLGQNKFNNELIRSATGKCRWELPGIIPLSSSWEAHRAVLDAHQPFRGFEYVRQVAGGAATWFSTSGVPQFDSENRFTGYRGTARDISVSRRAEETQRQASRFLDDVVDNIPIALTLKSVHDGYKMAVWNKAAEALYGVTRQEAVGRTVHDLWPQPDADRMYAADLDLVGRGAMQDFPDRATLTRHRGVIHVHMRKVPVKDASGAVTHVLITTEDITERKRVETALRASESRFRAVVAALAEGVVLRDAGGRIVDCNASAERILGKTLAQMQGQVAVRMDWQRLREDGSLLPDEEMPSVVACRTGLAQSNVVICYRKPEGTALWALINVQPLFEGGTTVPTGFVTTITDISKRKQAEMEIVRLNVDLENRVLRRTAQLEAANQELEAFSYSVAHDLRSPLSSINGFSALLQKALPAGTGEKANHYLLRIRAGVQRMGELTDGLLSLAQLSRTSLRWESVDISAEAAQLVRQYAERDAGRVVKVTVEPGLLVRADTALLRQVLENLIANAWKFSSKTSLASISIGKEIGAEQQPVYFVRDNGAGFDMAYADKLFGTFQRLHSPDEFSGSGIGLATVKRIITRHGGNVWAHSALGEGSTFYFTLGSEQAKLAPSDDAGIALAGLPRSSRLFTNSGGRPGVDVDGGVVSSDNDAFALSDRQFSNAFEHSAIGMALIAIDSRRLRVNSAFCQMLGYSEAEMLSRTVYDVTHPDDLEFDVQQRKRALAGEIETYQWEKRYFHKTGRIVWAHLSCSLVRDADRRPLLFISQVQDITERKHAEVVLRESEERFRALTELSSDWFWEQDEHFRFVQISGEVRHMHTAAFSGNAAIGKTRWELPHVNMDDDVWAAHKAQLERHEIFRDFEVTRLDNNGEIRYVTISGVPIFDASGCFAGYRGTGRDNTEMRRVSEALRRSEAQLREITDTVPALIAYVDAGHHFRFHNRAYEEAFGRSYGEIDGKHMREVMGEAFYDSLRPRVDEVLSGYPVVYERTQVTARGDHRDYVVNYFPRYSDEDGRVIGFYSLASDVTELKRIDRMKSEFVSTVSHELRTPLTSIRGSLGLISGGVAGQLPEAVKTLVGIAKNNCERLIRLINDILDIEKIESGKMRLDLQVIALKPLMVQALAANEGFGTAHNVGLNLHFPNDELRVHVDSDRLIQVVTNLLSNAMKFSPPGSPVEVHVTRGGIGVRVEVRDRGPGIPEEFHKRIFQKFSQADSSDTRKKGGTGLGLNISRAIIERMEGSIGFHTQANVGTTFFFELPEWKDLPVPAHSQALPSSRQRILVCEDDHDIARLICMMLDKGGFDADRVYSAAQALACLEQNSYAAMTVDLKLPDQDGITLIRTLRSQDNTRDLPIVVVSAMAGEGQLQFNNQLLSVSDWLDKPIDENLLIRGLRRAIDGMAEGKPRILHVEDDLDIQRITAAIVQDFATFEFAATLDEARARLLNQRFDLVLLDLSLPGGSGWDLLADIEALDPPPPVVVFSASEVDRAESSRAAAVLVKAQTSNDELLQTLQRVLTQGRASSWAPL